MRTQDQPLPNTAPKARIRAREEIRRKELPWEFPRLADEPLQGNDQRSTDRKWEAWRWPRSG
jgi:hypothetical protein